MEGQLLIIFPGLGQDQLAKFLRSEKKKVFSLNLRNIKDVKQFVNLDASKNASVEALEAIRSGKFDYVLVDTPLPVDYGDITLFIPLSSEIAVQLLGAPFSTMQPKIKEVMDSFMNSNKNNKIITVKTKEDLLSYFAKKGQTNPDLGEDDEVKDEGE